MIKWRSRISWAFAGIFLVSAIFLRDKMDWWIRWGSFGLFVALPLGIERTDVPPFLKRLLDNFWVWVCWAAALQWAFSHALSKHGINLGLLSVAAYVAIWIYRDIVFLHSGGANEDRTLGAKSVPPLENFLPILKSIAEEFNLPSLGLAVTNGAARHDWIAVTGAVTSMRKIP